MLAAALANAAGLSRRRRILAAMLLGAAGALALPPLGWLPFLVLSLSGLVWLADARPGRKGAFAAGWWWGFGHFPAGLWWIANALLTDPVRFGWMIPFAIFGLGAVLACFTGLATLLARLAVPRPGIVRVAALAVAWSGAEWLRGWVFTGFPWNLMATVWLDWLPVAQAASLIGAYALAIPTVMAAALPGLLAVEGERKAALAGLAVFWGALAVLGLWGHARIPEGPAPVVPGVALRLVQGNVDQSAKWRPELRAHHLYNYVALSRRPGWESRTVVVWPETAVPYFLESDAQARSVATGAVPPGGMLFTGSLRGTFAGNGAPITLWNSVLAIDPAGRIGASFDKVHLVPFGEYVPARAWLPLPKITDGATDFTPGTTLETLVLPGLPPVSPTICYEDIFPGRVALDEPRPLWLLNVTNDGWFGNSPGPYQHFAAARLRAIEEGLAMVRAANTGVTGIVDPYGRVVASLPLGREDILDGMLPEGLTQTPLYVRYRNWMILFVAFLVLPIAFAIRWYSK